RVVLKARVGWWWWNWGGVELYLRIVRNARKRTKEEEASMKEKSKNLVDLKAKLLCLSMDVEGGARESVEKIQKKRE
ncbi:hypothetical protein LINGRAHAP2_LOCUS15354, partial [Linum grandiflorum]